MFGSDFMTITDEDGTEYELEVLTTVEYNGFSYLAVIPAGNEEETLPAVSILKSEEDEDGEPLLCEVPQNAFKDTAERCPFLKYFVVSSLASH